MNRLVMKFGGTSLADMECVRRAAAHVRREVKDGHQVLVVVSAMGKETDRLIALTREAASLHDAREYDVVVSSGEQVSSGILALALQRLGIAARSWLGWQIPIRTNDMHGAARICRIDAGRICERLQRGEVVVAPGFQGVGSDERITTLGRGGSDASAVALAAAIGAQRCDIYTDVDGVYTADPGIVANARRVAVTTYEEMLEMASLGARVLQTGSVALAMRAGVPLLVRSSFDDPQQVEAGGKAGGFGTLIRDYRGETHKNRGRKMNTEAEEFEAGVVSGVTHSADEAKITLLKVADRPGVAAAIFGPLAEAGINVDMIVQNVSEDGKTTDMTFTLTREDLPRAIAALEGVRETLGYGRLLSDDAVAKVSVIGMGMRSHAGVAQRMFRALAGKGINIQVISTSEIKVSVLVDAQYTELAVRVLHDAFGLGGESEGAQD